MSYVKKLWKVLNQLTGKQQRDEIPGDLNANDYNDYFTSVGSDTVSHLNVAESCMPLDYQVKLMCMASIVNYYALVLTF